jgi:preprotein translocase subunit SecG
MLKTVLTVLQVFSAIAIVGLVLLQRGKGADAGAGFGAGASGTVFGARGASTGLSRATAVFAAVFMINSLLLTYLFQRDAARPAESILDRVPVQTTPVPATPAPATTLPAPIAAPSEAAPAAGPSVVPAPGEQPAPQPATP